MNKRVLPDDRYPLLLECFSGGTFYLSFNSQLEIDKFRKKHPRRNGPVYTTGGCLVNEDELRKAEKELIRKARLRRLLFWK